MALLTFHSSSKSTLRLPTRNPDALSDVQPWWYVRDLPQQIHFHCSPGIFIFCNGLWSWWGKPRLLHSNPRNTPLTGDQSKEGLTMKRIISKVVLVTLLTMALATLGVLPLFASEQYQIIDLGTLDGTETEAHLINNRGQVVGGSTLEGEYGPHAFLWEKGVMTDLGTLPGGDYSFAYAINERGQIVGYSEPEPQRACSSCKPYLFACFTC